MANLFDPLALKRGPALPNRVMLAPMTNQQSHADGTLSDDEFGWLVRRAEGGFGATMTCAAHVQRIGQGFPGQLGIFGPEHVPGLTRLAQAIKAHDSVALIQLHHAGRRAPAELIGEQPVAPSEKSGARALSTAEVEQLRDAFVAAAVRAQDAGFDGVELHGAHGYILHAFLSAENVRTDAYGDGPRLLREIIDGVRAACRSDFTLGVRISPERWHVDLPAQVELARELLGSGQLDFIDLSLWDAFKEPTDHPGRLLVSHFSELERNGTALGAAGKITTPEDAQRTLDNGCDFVLVGRAGVLHHDWPRHAADAAWEPVALPVSREHLRNESLSEPFIDYMDGWEGFVAP